VIDRRTFLSGTGAVLLAAPLAADAQQAGKVYRIGLLGAGSQVTSENRQAFEQALRERGWVTGENLVIAYRYAEGQYDRLPALAAEMVRLEPQVIVAVPTAAARAAREATSTIPIVMLLVSDPVDEGLIASVARPGGNVTGPTLTPTREIFAKQLQLLREAVPRAKRIAFLWNPAGPTTAGPATVRIVQAAAPSLGVELQVVGVTAPEEIEPAFRAMSQARADALFVLIDSMFFTHRGRLADLSVRHRLPSMYGFGAPAKAGGLMAYGVKLADAYRQAAGYVDKLLRGANPADLPVEQPTKFELVINLKTAKALGLTIPQSLLQRADELIQ
jgi:putative tryptophan/tyrosine transport system substrate-binding protein